MSKDNQPKQRLKYYGLNDYATYFNVEQTVQYLDQYDATRTDYTLNEALELYNALRFVENEVFPRALGAKKRSDYKALIPKLNKNIAMFFNSISETNASKIIVDVDREYHQDLLSIMAKYKVYDRVLAQTMLKLLKKSHIGAYSILENKDIVQIYNENIRTFILSDPQNAEYLAQKYFEAENRNNIHLPPSFSPTDARTLLETYIDSGNANLNYLNLIAQSRVNKAAGLDAKLKLKAKKVHEASTEELFKDNTGGMTYGCEVRISDNQTEPLKVFQENNITKYSYSKKYLEDHSDNPSVISNFINLFGFVHDGMILSLPSYHSELGIFERFMGIKGKEFYPTGIAFQFREQSALLQTLMYEQFLRSGKVQLESVASWFFSEYIKNRFGADNFKYTASSSGSTYLEKSRHVFTEMESVIKQFTLYAENGEMDKELLAMSSDQVRYKDIPSLITNKYAYATKNDDIAFIQYTLFSDQSGLTHINDSLKDSSFALLLSSRDVKYDDFLDHQKPQIDKLIKLGVLVKEKVAVKFRSEDQLTVLKHLFDIEALSYYHCTIGIQSEINSMVSKDWLVIKSSLLTEAEASYFNYYLNQKDFSNGLDLRNRYLHGSQADKEDENEHYKTYIMALKLLMALIIKVNSDFLLQKLLKSDNK